MSCENISLWLWMTTGLLRLGNGYDRFTCSHLSKVQKASSAVIDCVPGYRADLTVTQQKPLQP